MLDIETLIREVHVRRSIWDQKHPTHHNRKAVHKLWKEIADSCDTTVHAARKKWKSLRDCFRTEYKKQIKAKANAGSTFVLPSTWLWYKDLLFLRGQIGTKRKVHNIPQTMQDTESDPDETKFDIHYEDLKVEVVDPTSPVVPCVTPDQHCETKTNETTTTTNSVDRTAAQEENEDPAGQTVSANLNLPTAKQTAKKCNPNRPEIPLRLFNTQDLAHLNALREDDCYYFLMSLHRPLNSLPTERAMFVRCKIQELIYNEISRINQR